MRGAHLRRGPGVPAQRRPARAGAENIDVEVARVGDDIRLEVSDDGDRLRSAGRARRAGGGPLRGTGHARPGGRLRRPARGGQPARRRHPVAAGGAARWPVTPPTPGSDHRAARRRPPAARGRPHRAAGGDQRPGRGRARGRRRAGGRDGRPAATPRDPDGPVDAHNGRCRGDPDHPREPAGHPDPRADQLLRRDPGPGRAAGRRDRLPAQGLRPGHAGRVGPGGGPRHTRRWTRGSPATCCRPPGRRARPRS